MQRKEYLDVILSVANDVASEFGLVPSEMLPLSLRSGSSSIAQHDIESLFFLRSLSLCGEK